MPAVYTTLWPCDVNLFHEWCEENEIDLEGDAADDHAPVGQFLYRLKLVWCH